MSDTPAEAPDAEAWHAAMAAGMQAQRDFRAERLGNPEWDSDWDDEVEVILEAAWSHIAAHEHAEAEYELSMAVCPECLRGIHRDCLAACVSPTARCACGASGHRRALPGPGTLHRSYRTLDGRQVEQDIELRPMGDNDSLTCWKETPMASDTPAAKAEPMMLEGEEAMARLKHWPAVEQFIAEAREEGRAEEREACARAAEQYATVWAGADATAALQELAGVIRARSQP